MRFHVDPCLLGYRSDSSQKSPCVRKETRGGEDGSAAGPGPVVPSRVTAVGPIARVSHRSHPSSEVLALFDVGRAARGVADAAGSCPRLRSRVIAKTESPATLAFALSRRGLFYPLASLDISGQWPVFEQEPHRNGLELAS